MSVPSALRPLPPRPSLEFEHKEAKALLRRLRAGDPDALARARARHPAFEAPLSARLADAQLVIAREYGFASWPRLVRYFGDVDRQRRGLRQRLPSFPHDGYEGLVRGLLAEHRDRRVLASHALGSYVPRFYGMRADDVFASVVTEDEAWLAIARQSGFPSWAVLMERVDAMARERMGGRSKSPLQRAGTAIGAGDLATLQSIMATHPELLNPPVDDDAAGHGLLTAAVYNEVRQPTPVRRAIVDWLVAQGLDLQRELNVQLCGSRLMRPEMVRYLLDRGADPNWVTPNGIPVIEHALIIYWSGDAVDVLAERAVPRDALWIAAGLGDVDGVRRSLDRHGQPTAAARRLLPDFDAVGFGGMTSFPDPSDEEVLVQALVIAMLNGRAAVLDYMLSRGCPVNSLVWGSPIINVAVGNGMTTMVECLVRGGADLDLRGYRPSQTAREIARSTLAQMPNDVERRRIADLCGLDPDAVIAEHEARPAPPPSLTGQLREALRVAGDDAFALGQSDIRVENLLFGLLRTGGPSLELFVRASQMDADRFYADVADRLRPVEGHVERLSIPLHADAQATMDAAVALAVARRRSVVQGSHLLAALVQADRSVAVEILTRYGASVATLNDALDTAL